MLSFFTKIGLAGGAVCGVFLIEPSDSNFGTTKNEKKMDEAEKTFATLEDVELFEKNNGCSFVYVDKWGEKVLWGARAIVEKQANKEDAFKNAVISGANGAKEACKRDKGVITLINNSGWKQGEPSGGWAS